VLGFGLLACGSTSGPVLERVQPIEPPEFTHRVDAFLTAGVSSCAVGRACASTDPSDCFYVGSAANRTMFEPASVEFVRAGDARLAGAERSACFELDLDEPTRDLVARSFGDLRDEIYRASRGAIDLDLRFHLVTPPLGVFKLFEGGSGLFLQPDTLAAVGLPLMSPDSDFVFGVTGETNAESGALPKISPCAGTNWQAQGGLGGAAYTWLSASCAELSELRFHCLLRHARRGRLGRPVRRRVPRLRAGRGGARALVPPPHRLQRRSRCTSLRRAELRRGYVYGPRAHEPLAERARPRGQSLSQRSHGLRRDRARHGRDL
jgi:hypothetical protein